MDHIIQPIEIAGSLRCPTVASGYRSTAGFLTTEIISGTNTADVSTDNPWILAELPASDIAGEGEITFGVTCGDLVVMEFEAIDASTDPDFLVEIWILGEGIEIGPISLTQGSAFAGSVEVDLTETACGNLLAITASVTRADTPAEASDGIMQVTANVMSIS